LGQDGLTAQSFATLDFSMFGERYIEWAEEKQRRAVRDIANNATNKQIQALNVEAQAALSSVNSNLIPIKQVLETLVMEIKNLRETVDSNAQQQMQQHHGTLAMSQSIRLRQNPPATGATREQMLVELCPPATLVPYFPTDLPSSKQTNSLFSVSLFAFSAPCCSFLLALSFCLLSSKEG
jgi:hypothetical protein